MKRWKFKIHKWFKRQNQNDQKKLKKVLILSFLPLIVIWKEKSFADVTFVVQNEEILANVAILLKSRYFQNLNKSIFQVFLLNDLKIDGSNKIEIRDISLSSLKGKRTLMFFNKMNFLAILEYIYFFFGRDLFICEFEWNWFGVSKVTQLEIFEKKFSKDFFFTKYLSNNFI